MIDTLTPEEALKKATAPPAIGSLKPEEALKYAATSDRNKSILPTDSKVTDFSPVIEQTDGNSKYDAGYIAGSEPLQNYRAENQSGMAQVGAGLARLAGSTVLDVAKGFSTLGSAIGVGAADAVIGISNSTSDDEHQQKLLGLDDITDNPVNNLFYGLDDAWKKQMPVYKTDKYDGKNLLQQMATTGWWADEGADVGAFMLSNMVAGGALGKVGLGVKLASGLDDLGVFGKVAAAGEQVGKMGKLGELANEVLIGKSGLSSPVKFASNLDHLAQEAYMTTSEAFFMSKDAGEAVSKNYLGSKGVESEDELNPQDKAELVAKKAQAEKYTFWANMAALTFSSHVERGFINKVFGHATPENIKGLVNLGEGLADDATAVPSTGVQKFFASKLGSYAKNIPKYALLEGGYKANVQNSIQAISTQFGYTGALDYMQQVAKLAVNNLGNADAYKQMGANLVLGTFMGAVGGAKEAGEQTHAVNNAVKNINAHKENYINLQNTLYQRDADNNVVTDVNGTPKYNVPAIVDYASNTLAASDMQNIHDTFKNQGDEAGAKLVKNELFTKYALSHLEAGLGDEFMAKVKSLNSYKDEDLAKLGYDPIEIGPNGNKITIAERTQSLVDQATQIQKDYNQAKRTIGYVDYFKTGDKTGDYQQNLGLQNSRTNEAVKLSSRMRSLDGLMKDSSTRLLELQAKTIQGSSYSTLVEGINTQARQLDATKNAFARGLQNGNIDPESRIAKQYSSQIQEQEKAIIEQKNASKDVLEKLGYNVSLDAKELTDEQPESPDVTESKSHLQDIEDAKVAKIGLQDRYNKITDYNKGAENFVKGGVAKTILDIEDENQRQDEQNTTANELAQYNEGDFVEYGDQKGYLTPNDKGELSVNGNTLSKAFLDQNPNLRVLSPAETQNYKDSKLKEFRQGQLQSRISQVQRRIDAILTKDGVKQEAILNHLISIDDLMANKEKGISRISERQLARQVSTIQDTITQLENERQELLQQKNELQSKIEDIQDDQANGDINDNYKQLDTYQKNIDAINQSVQENEGWIAKLQDALKTFQNLWKSFFPNKALNLEKGRKEYTDAKAEIQLTKDQLQDLESTNADLLGIKKGIEDRMKFLEKEINDYELEASKLEYNPAATPETTTDVIENPPTVSSSPIPSIEGKGLFKTAGANSKEGILNEKESQRVWGDYTNKFDPKNPEGHYLRTVTINDPTYGVGKDRDIYKEDDAKYHTKDNIKVIVVDKTNEPIRDKTTQSRIYTSLPEITDTKTEPEHFPNFRYEDKELAKQSIEEYRKFINEIKNSPIPLKLQITGKSNGRIVVGEPIDAAKAFGKQLPLIISLASKDSPYTTIGGNDYPIPSGLVYVNYNGRPVGAETRTLTPKESQATLNLLKEYAKLRGDSNTPNNGQIINQLKGIVLLNQRSGNSQFDLYFVKGKNEFIFGDKVISTKDLAEGKYDEQVREFLDNQNHQVDNKLLTKNTSYTDVFGKTWSSYQDYLLSPRETVIETPLTFKIQPLSDDINKPQFLNTYLTYSKPKNEVEEVKLQEKTSEANKVAFDLGTNFSFVSLSSMIDSRPLAQQLEPTEQVSQLIEENEGNATTRTATTKDEPGTIGRVTQEITADRRPNEEKNTNVIQDNLLDEFYLEAKPKDYVPIDFDKEKNWFEQNISTTIPFQKVQGLVDKMAYGKFSKAGQVLISDVATAGTGYHEAFHVVSQLYLDDKERSELYNQFRKDTNNPQANDRLVEEGLAEEFREYMLTKESPYKSFFDKIVNFIKGLLGIGNDDKKLLFSRISNGYFVDSKLKSSSDLDLYKLSDKFDANTTRDIMDSMTLTLVRGMFKNNFSLGDLQRFNDGLLSKEDADNFKNLYTSVISTMNKSMLKAAETQPNGEHLKNVAKYLDENKASVQLDHIKYLKKFKINIEVEPENQYPQDFERAKDTLGIISAIEFSSKSGMPNVIKLMIASLPKLRMVDGKAKSVLNNLGLPQLSDYKRNIAILTNELAGISSFEEQMKKVTELATRVPDFMYLFDLLGVSQGQTTPVNLRQDFFDLQAKFRQQFDKAYYSFYTQLYEAETDENGQTTGKVKNYLIDSNADKLNNLVKARWKGNAFANKEAYNIKNGQYILNPEYFKRTYDKPLGGAAKVKSVLSFYKDLGITFSQPGLVDIDVLADKQKALITKMQENEISSIFQDEAESKGFVNSLIQQEVASSLDYTDNQHINPEGKTVYNVSLHNYLSRIAAEINQLPIRDGKKVLPEELTWNEEFATGNPMMRHSSWLDKLSKGKQIKVGILEGARLNEPGESGTGTSKLSTPDAASQQFTSILNGQSPYMRAGDKALEHSFNLGEAPKYASIGEITDYFKGHLSDELLSSYMLNVEGAGAEFPEYAKSANDLRVFKGVLNKTDEVAYKAIINNKSIDRQEAIRQIDAFADKDSVKASLQDWFDKYSEENKQLLLDNNLATVSDGIYSLIGVPAELADKFVGKEDALSEGQMKSLVEQFTYNQLQGNIEQTKFFTGDLAFYTYLEKATGVNKNDFFKRTSGPTGTGKTTWMGDSVNEWLNQNRPRQYQSYDGKIKVDKQSNGKISSLMFNDIKAVSKNFQTYLDNLVGKGLSKEYANKLLANYNKGYDEGDAQGYLTLPEYREFLTRTGDWTPSHEVLYPKLIRGEEVTAKEFGDFISGYPVVKPQYFGKQTDANGLFVPTFYKFSAMPLIPSVVRGTELEELMHTMLENGHGLAVFKTGNKVGAKEGNNLYDENNKINLEADNLIQQELDYASMKIQLDIDPKVKSKVIFGTQFRKLLQSGLFNKTLTINGNKVNGNKILDTYKDLLNKVVQVSMNKLVDKLGITDAGNGQYRISNTEYLRNVLSNEALRREAPDNLLEGIRQVLPEKGATRQFDILVSRNQIENILMSLVDNSVIKQKTFGDMRVQGAPTGFQGKDGENPTSFYQPNENGTEPMKVMMPHYFTDDSGKPLDIGMDDISDKRLLRMVGYRTPTANLSEMDILEIAKFHPQEAGNLLTKPSETVVKDGSDYDVDKESLHFPNYEVVNGRPQYLEYDKNNPEHQTDLRRLYNRINEIAWRVLEAPENFQRLISPNSTGQVEEIANEVAKIKEKTASELDNGKGYNISWKKNLQVREAYMAGKEGIGIAAIHNTNHVLNQIVGLKTKPEVKIHLEHNETTEQIDFSREREVGADPVNSPTILDNLGSFLNGLVDMANNPFLSTINVSTETLPTYLYLIKAGVPLRQVIMFMNQPILSDYIRLSNANDSIGLKAIGAKLSQEDLQQKVMNLYPAKQAKLDLTNPLSLEAYKKTITTNKLEEYIKGNENNPVQQQLFRDYLEYKDQAEGLSDLIKATTADTRGTGPTMNSAQNTLDLFDNLKENSIFEGVDKYMNDTFVGAFQKAIEKSVQIYKPVFHTEKIDFKNELARIKRVTELSKFSDSEKIMNLAKNDIINFVLQSAPTDGTAIKNLTKGLYQSIAKNVAEAKEHEAFKDNALIRELYPLISANSSNEIGTPQDLDNLKMFSKKLDAMDSNTITEAWKELFGIHEQFAMNLMVFTTMQSGLNNSPVSFSQYVPNEYYTQLTDRLLTNREPAFDGFYDKFIRNNYQNNDLVPKISKYVMTKNGLITVADGKEARVLPPRRSSVTGKLVGADNTKYDYIKAWSKKLGAFELYKNTGEVRGDRGAVIFERVSKLGDSYNLKEWTDESIIMSNRLPNVNVARDKTVSLQDDSIKARAQKLVEGSLFTEEKKQEYTKRLADAKSDKDLIDLIKDICS